MWDIDSGNLHLRFSGAAEMCCEKSPLWRSTANRIDRVDNLPDCSGIGCG